jgi:hypothetical protein
MMPYTPIRNKAFYESLVSSDPKKLANFRTIWADIDLVDLKDYVDRYNRLEGTGNVTDLNNLLSDINTSYASLKAYQGKYTPDVEKANNDMLSRLSAVRSKVQSEIAMQNKKPKTSLGQKILATRKFVGRVKHGVNSVVEVYDKFTGPAESLYDRATKDDGGASFYQSISNFGKRKKK